MARKLLVTGNPLEVPMITAPPLPLTLDRTPDATMLIRVEVIPPELEARDVAKIATANTLVSSGE